MHRLTLKDEKLFPVVRDWLLENDHNASWDFEYRRSTAGTKVVFKIRDDSVAVTLKLILGHLFV